MASARQVAGRVDGSEVDDANSALGASIVTAGESGGIEKWEDVSCPASPAESSPARWRTKVWIPAFDCCPDSFFLSGSGTRLERFKLKEDQMPRFIGGTSEEEETEVDCISNTNPSVVSMLRLFSSVATIDFVFLWIGFASQNLLRFA